MKKPTKSLKEFCEKQELVRVAYSERSNSRVVPVWFVVVGRDYYIGTSTSSPKWKAIKRKPRVAWVIDGGEEKKYKGMSMFGQAEEVTDKKLRAKIYRALGEKYYGSADDPGHREIWGEVDDPATVYMRLKAEGGSYWSY